MSDRKMPFAAYAPRRRRQPYDRLCYGRVWRSEVKTPSVLGSVFIPRWPAGTLCTTMRSDGDLVNASPTSRR